MSVYCTLSTAYSQPSWKELQVVYLTDRQTVLRQCIECGPFQICFFYPDFTRLLFIMFYSYSKTGNLFWDLCCNWGREYWINQVWAEQVQNKKMLNFLKFILVLWWSIIIIRFATSMIDPVVLILKNWIWLMQVFINSA